MPDQLDHQQSLLKITKAMINMPAQILLYGLVLLSIVAIGGVSLPGIFATLATTVGVNLLSNMLERVASGDNVSDDEIRKTVDDAIKDSGIESLVTSNEFYRIIGRLFRQFDLLEYAVKRGEINVAKILCDQFANQKEILEELQNQISLVNDQLKNLATRDQNEEILSVVRNIEKNQKASFGILQPSSASLSFSVKFVDKQIENEIEKLRKSRFFSEFDRNGFSLNFGEQLISGEFSGGTPSLRSRALAWCSRILSNAENINKAEEYFNIAQKMGGGSPEIEIAHAFIVSQKGDKNTALKILASINMPIARSAACIIVANHDGQSRYIDWLNSAGFELSSLDSDGKRFHLAQLLEIAQWDSALTYIVELTDHDLQEAPILNHLIAITHLLSVVPEELRKYVCAQIPLEVSTFPLASGANDIIARRKARQYFFAAAAVASQLNCSNAATIDTEYALWLELTDPEEFSSGKQKLEKILRSQKRVLRYVNLGIQFGVKFNLDLIEQEIDQQVALYGGYTIDTAIARFAIVYTKKTRDAAIYISQHQDQLAKFLDRKYLLSFQIELLLRSGLIDQAKDCLNLLISDGISEADEGVIRRRISELEGSDAVEMRKEQYRKSNSLIDLENLIDELEARRDWDSLCEYSKLLFEKTHYLHDAERLVYSWSMTHNYEKLLEFLKGNQALLPQSKMLQFNYCVSLYYEGALLEARSELIKLDDDRDNPNYRALQINLGISLGDWISLLVIVAHELAQKDRRNAQELLLAAQLAINLGSPHAKDLIFSAVGKDENDARVLATAYFLASGAGWENETGVFQWIEKAAELSDDDGPIQRMSLKDILDRKPEWDRRESDTWNLLSRGEIPIFIAARSLNKTLIDMVLFPALTNLTQKDPRRRGIVAAYSGKRQSKSLEIYKSVGLDATTLLTLSFLNLLDRVFGLFDTIYLPHSILLWLFEEKMRSMFHQPSRIRDARKISQLLLSGALEKLVPCAIIDSELSSQVGDELAELIAEAIKGSDADNVQRIVVRSSPVHQITSLMEEEVDLTQYVALLSSCQAIVEKLRQKGQITGDEERRAIAYLRLQEKLWPNQPEITDGAILYLDDLTVGYFLHLGILDKLSAAGFRPVISTRKVSEANDLISFEEISGKFNESIERIRFAVNSGINSGKIKIGKQQTFDDNESKPLSQHPTIEVVGLAKICEAIIVDDRFLNQHEYINSGDLNTPVFTSLDLLDTLVITGTISDADKLECITLLRRAGYLLIPIIYDDLAAQLTASKVKDADIIETAELKALRENVLRIRMSSWLQLPQEAFWLDKSVETFIQVLQGLWESEADILAAQAKSNWIIDQMDIRGWAHRIDGGLADNLVKNGRSMQILLLLMPPRNVSEEVRQEYLAWVGERILAPIKESNPEQYSWILSWQKTQISKLANMDINAASEDSHE